MKTIAILTASAVTVMLIAVPLLAHHSFAGTYLEDAKPQEIKGTPQVIQCSKPSFLRPSGG
jgi:hypothetical protein